MSTTRHAIFKSVAFCSILVAAGCAGTNLEPDAGGGGGNSKTDAGHPADRITRDVVVNETTIANCGNGVLDENEQCDDGNKDLGDGCNAFCQIEPDYVCPTPGQPCMNIAVCGNGILTSTETCDDGNTVSGDGCSADCQTVEPGYQCRVPGKPCVPFCGDGMIIGTENCDDGNDNSGDGCSSTCLTEPGWDCSTGTCVQSVCGDGKLQRGESCDAGDSNGLFFGDGTGCSKTCTKEPNCRDASGHNRACDATCGNGNLDPGEGCDDGNLDNGDGCSSTCTPEAGFTCTSMPQEDAQDCSNGTGKCLRLPIVYRDFKNETLTGGHPDFFYYGGTSVVAPTTGQMRTCVPNSGGLNRKVTSGDSTARCWGIADPTLLNGKPVYAMGATSTASFMCPCQFTDWSANNAGQFFPTPQYNFSTQSPIRTLPNNAGQPAPGWSSVAAGTPGVQLVVNGTTFGQWYKDGTGFSTRTQGILELPLITPAAGATPAQYQFSSDPDTISGGFFPLDAIPNPGEPLICNLWPYWYAWPGCKGDQYLFPPTQGITAAQGAWWPATAMGNPAGTAAQAVTGHPHDFYATTEVHYLFVYNPGMILKFYGDDDLFIYINGTLVLDLGGIHQRLPGQVTVSGTPGNAAVIEGGILDTATGNIVFSYAPDPVNNPTMLTTLTQPGDYRMRNVTLGLVPGQIYEIAVFGADRAPTESNYQLSLSGFQTTKSVCQPHCGDGIVSGGEECDCGDGTVPMGAGCDGPNNDTTYGGCTTQCKFGPFCGDDIPNGTEQCDLGKDNGSSNGPDGCTIGCLKPHFCGDGILDPGEQCDLGSQNGSPTVMCSATCIFIPG
jgi:fibro-slime domain-containing protein